MTPQISKETQHLLSLEERLHALSKKVISFVEPPSPEEREEVHCEIATLRNALMEYLSVD